MHPSGILRSCHIDLLETRPHLVVQEDVDHLEVLVVDGHEEGRAAERVAAVDVEALLHRSRVRSKHPKEGK